MKQLIRTVWIAVVFTVSTAAWATEITLRDDHPNEYIVKRGDTLWSISAMFLRDPWQWPEIWGKNPQVSDPHLIYPGDRLVLVYGADGRPMLRIDRGDGYRTVRLSPTVRVEPNSEAISAIPLELIHPFLTRNLVLNSEYQLDGLPYVVAGADRHILAGAGDKIYARGDFSKLAEGYSFYRMGDVYRDPESGGILGYQAKEIGTAKMLDLEKEIATFRVNSSNTEVLIGDYVIPSLRANLTATFYPKPPAQSYRDGLIVAVEGGVSHIGRLDTVVINRGQNHGVDEGSVLRIEQSGERIRDPKTNQVIRLPVVEAGLLMVFRTFDNMSYGLVLEANRAIAIGDRLASPTS